MLPVHILFVFSHIIIDISRWILLDVTARFSAPLIKKANIYLIDMLKLDKRSSHPFYIIWLDWLGGSFNMILELGYFFSFHYSQTLPTFVGVTLVCLFIRFQYFSHSVPVRALPLLVCAT
jgi:hypothetical protein